MAAVSEPGAVAILAHTFPLHSATYIADEVRELDRLGLAPALLAIRAPRASDVPATMDDLRRRTRTLLPAGPLAVARAHARTVATRPRGYLRALGLALFAGRLSPRHRLRTLVHFGEAVALAPVLREIGCVHLHVHALSGVATIALLLKPLGGPPYSLTAHGTDIFVEQVLLAEKIGGACFTRVGTEFNRDYLAGTHGADASRIRVMPFGVDERRFRPAPRPPGDGTLRLLSVGRLVWQKAHHLLIGACARLRRRGHALRLTVIGEGEERPALEALVARLGLDGVVDLPGAASSDDVAEALRAADLFALASVSEGFGIVLLEAMACGVPVVAPALRGLPEVVTDGVEGILFTPGSEEALAQAVEGLAADPERRRRMGEAGRQRVVATCRLEDRAGRFAQVLRAAIAGESS